MAATGAAAVLAAAGVEGEIGAVLGAATDLAAGSAVSLGAVLVAPFEEEVSWEEM